VGVVVGWMVVVIRVVVGLIVVIIRMVWVRRRIRHFAVFFATHAAAVMKAPRVVASRVRQRVAVIIVVVGMSVRVPIFLVVMVMLFVSFPAASHVLVIPRVVIRGRMIRMIGMVRMVVVTVL